MKNGTPRQVIRERSAGVVPVRRTNRGYRLLVLRSYRSWDFPKGRVEEGESLMDAALREAAEEAALDDLEFPWGEAYCTTQPYGRGKVASYFLASTHQSRVILPVNPELGRPEHHEGRWVSFAAAAFLLPPRLQPVLAWAHNVIVEGRPVQLPERSGGAGISSPPPDAPVGEDDESTDLVSSTA